MQKEIAFTPARVLLQDFTGVPAVVDLAAMRDGIVRLGGDPAKVNPLQPVELVIDHSVQVDHYAELNAADLNAALEFTRNKERYTFLRWGQEAFDNFRVVPPDTGIVHQVNLEYLARVVFKEQVDGRILAYPDTLVGTDSHTTMVNGLGVVGWGVGGIEAEAAMLGQPISMLIPEVVGFRLVDRLPEGATATDLVLTITERLRKFGVVGKFVEFFGPGLESLTIADRATLGNMSPEYGATIAICPIDEMTLDYLRLTARDESHVELVEAYAREQGLFRDAECAGPGLQRHAGAGPLNGRTESRRSQASPGPRLASPVEGEVCAGARDDAGGKEAESVGARDEAWRDHNAGREHLDDCRRPRTHPRDRRPRSWLGRCRGHHQLHQHLQSERDDWRRAAGAQRRPRRTHCEAVGEDEPRARLADRHRVLQGLGPARVSRRSSDSTSSVTAALRVSATAGPCRSTSRPSSATRISSSPPF